MQDNTRYINVSIDIGGLKPYPASYVARNKYGDCKALTNYMKTLLETAGIKSYYTKIHTGDNPLNINKGFPSQQFNHVILTVPVQPDTVWLECTDSNNPLGYLGVHTHNRYALLVDGDSSCLIKTPGLTVRDVCSVKKINFTFSHLDVCQCDMEIVFRGDKFEYLAQFEADLTDQQQSEFIHSVIPFSNYDLISWDIKRDKRDSPEILFKAKLLLHSYVKKYSDMIISEMYPSGTPSFEIPERRKLPVRINYPVCQTDTITYFFPSGYRVNPDISLEFTSKYGFYSLLRAVTDDSLIIIRTLHIYSGEYSLAEYPDLYDFFQTIINCERANPIVFKTQ
jgi:hypothetical protein